MVVDYLRGKDGLRSLKSLQPKRVLHALKQIDTEMMEDLGVSPSNLSAFKKSMQGTLEVAEKQQEQQQREARRTPARAAKVNRRADRFAYLVRKDPKLMNESGNK